MVLLYHERQVAALCGVHCLNTLLQVRCEQRRRLVYCALADPRRLTSCDACRVPGSARWSSLRSLMISTRKR